MNISRHRSRQILHVDMDAFFAAIEQKRHPELVGQPLVIGGRGDPTARGVVSTASYEARRFGIHSGMPLRMTYRLCPQAVFLPVDYEEYARVSAQVKAVLKETTALVEDAGIDEAYLDITDVSLTAQEVAARMKHRIREETALTCSIGIAPNKLLAKIASDMQKPDGLTIISETGIEERLAPLPVRKIPGVGPVTEERLGHMGIATIGQLASLPLDRLVHDFGHAHGRFLYEAARGQDDTPVITHWEPKSRGREITFQEDTGDRQKILRTLAALSREVADEIAQQGYQARTVSIKVRFSDFETHTRGKTLDEATDSYEALKRAAFECLGRLELYKKVRLIGVRVGGLQKSETQ